MYSSRYILFFFILLTQATLLSAPKKSAKQTNNLIRLGRKTGLSKTEAIKLSTFIDKELKNWVKKNGPYLSRNKTALPRAIEYDPKTGLTFIHLENYGGLSRIGKGSKKIVTKSILYKVKKPKVVASSTTYKPLTDDIHREIKATKKLQGKKGFFKVHAITKRKRTKKQKVVTFITKLYNKGSLAHALRNQKLTFKQKLKIAHDMAAGLHRIHKLGYIHRDLCPQNVLIEKKGKKVRAVLADFGRAFKIKDAHGIHAEGHSLYLAPEGVDFESLDTKEYIPVEIYALGSIYYRLFFNKKPSCSGHRFIKDETISPTTRMTKYKALVEKHFEDGLSRLYGQKMKKAQFQIKKLTLKMMHPDPTLRGTTASILKELKSI